MFEISKGVAAHMLKMVKMWEGPMRPDPRGRSRKDRSHMGKRKSSFALRAIYA